MDITDLEQGYAGLIAEARLGGFSAPPPGEWTAEQIIAHVAANDELIFKATSQVLAGQPHPYYNHDAINTEELNKRNHLGLGRTPPRWHHICHDPHQARAAEPGRAY